MYNTLNSHYCGNNSQKININSEFNINFGPSWPFGNNDNVNQQEQETQETNISGNTIDIVNSTINVDGSPTTSTTADPCVAVCEMLEPDGPWTFAHDALNGGCVCDN